MVRGIAVVPTQMMVSLEQEHPEGHLKFLLELTARLKPMRRKLINSHCFRNAMMQMWVYC